LQPFWQTTHGVAKDISQVKAQLKKLCSKATAIEVEGRSLDPLHEIKARWKHT
jgi:hypothetical protein